MKMIQVMVMLSLCLLIYGCQSNSEPISMPTPAPVSNSGKALTIPLPEPRQDGDVSLEQSLLQRRSIRSFADKPLTLGEVSQILWAAQGITDARGHRTAPSAGALYPLELYLVAGNVDELTPGIYSYKPERHELELLSEGDIRVDLARAALGQTSVRDGALAVVFTAIYKRTTGKYGERGVRYVHIEVGHAAQNLVLQATAMDLGAVTVGAFEDEKVADIMGLPDDEKPLYIIPVGRK